jgi:hypothetical protein
MVAAFTITFSPPSQAQPATSVAPSTVIVGGGYRQDNAQISCPTPSIICVLRFGAVPSGKVFVVTNIGCRFSTTSTTGLHAIALTRATEPASHFNHLAPVLLKEEFGQKIWSLNNQVLKIYKAGERPAVWFQVGVNDGNQAINCEIAGKTVP